MPESIVQQKQPGSAGVSQPHWDGFCGVRITQELSFKGEFLFYLNLSDLFVKVIGIIGRVVGSSAPWRLSDFENFASKIGIGSADGDRKVLSIKAKSGISQPILSYPQSRFCA